MTKALSVNSLKQSMITQQCFLKFGLSKNMSLAICGGEYESAARGHATLIDGIVLHATKITLPVYHVVADVRFIHRRSTGMFHDGKRISRDCKRL